MTRRGVIVLERTGRWATCVRGVGRDLPVQCRSVRRVGQCVAEARQAPGSVVLIDAADLEDGALPGLVEELASGECRAFVVVLLEGASSEVECLLRELGAGQVFRDTPTAAELGGILTRCLATL